MEYDWLEGQLEQPNLSDYSGHYASQIPDGVFTRVFCVSLLFFWISSPL